MTNKQRAYWLRIGRVMVVRRNGKGEIISNRMAMVVPYSNGRTRKFYEGCQQYERFYDIYWNDDSIAK